MSILTDPWIDHEPDAVPALQQKGVPKDWSGPEQGSWIGARQMPDGKWDAWHRTADRCADISDLVTDVTTSDGGYRVTGRKVKHGYPCGAWDKDGQWEALLTPDGECGGEQVSGTVR